MFWGSYSVKYGKGPTVFWEKEWGSITGEKYAERIVPLVDMHGFGFTQARSSCMIMLLLILPRSLAMSLRLEGSLFTRILPIALISTRSRMRGTG
jgi:hypothetical protein